MKAVFLLILCELLIVAWVDFKTCKISNKWILLNSLLALGFYLFLPEIYRFSWEIFVFPIGFIVGGFFLYLANIMGAGDSKFLASLFLMTPLEFHFSYFEKLAVSTIITGGILLLYRISINSGKLRAYLVNRYWEGIKATIKSRFSYAPVILLAWMLLGRTLWN